MSRRTDLLQQIIASDNIREDKEAELILTDLVNIALNGVEQKGAGSLIINLINDSTTYLSGEDIEFDLVAAEEEEDDDIVTFLRGLLEKIDENDWSNNVLITLISDAGTRTFSLEAGGCQESLRTLAAEFS